MAAAASSSKLMNRANGVLGFFIGIFGSLAILGVFFKIAKLPHYELFMTIGFFGEAAAFVVMGLFALIAGFTAKAHAEAGEAGHGHGVGPMVGDLRIDLDGLGEEFRQELLRAASGFREEMSAMLRARFGSGLEAVADGATQDVQFFGVELRELGEEMQRARSSVHALRGQLDRVATDRLAEDANALGGQMHQLCEEVSGAAGAAERMRADLEVMAGRFSAFNHVGDVRTRANGQTAWIAGNGDRHEHSEVTR